MSRVDYSIRGVPDPAPAPPPFGHGLALRLRCCCCCCCCCCFFFASFLNSSIVFKISSLPLFAFTFCWPILMLISLPVGVVKSLLSSKCFMMAQTNTPQSLLFSCCGESFRSVRWISRSRSLESFSQTISAGGKFAECRLS